MRLVQAPHHPVEAPRHDHPHVPVVAPRAAAALRRRALLQRGEQPVDLDPAPGGAACGPQRRRARLEAEEVGTVRALVHPACERWATRFPDRVVTDSRRVQQYYRERYQAASTYIAYGADPVAQRRPGPISRVTASSRAGTCSSLGGWCPENCAHHLIEAWKDLATDMLLRDRRRRALRGGVHSVAEGHR